MATNYKLLLPPLPPGLLPSQDLRRMWGRRLVSLQAFKVRFCSWKLCADASYVRQPEKHKLFFSCRCNSMLALKTEIRGYRHLPCLIHKASLCSMQLAGPNKSEGNASYLYHLMTMTPAVHFSQFTQQGNRLPQANACAIKSAASNWRHPLILCFETASASYTSTPHTSSPCVTTCWCGVIKAGSHLLCLMDLQTGLVREALLNSNTDGRDAVHLLSDTLVLCMYQSQTTCSILTMFLSPRKITDSCCSCTSYLFSKLVVRWLEWCDNIDNAQSRCLLLYQAATSLVQAAECTTRHPHGTSGINCLWQIMLPGQWILYAPLLDVTLMMLLLAMLAVSLSA